MSHGYKSTVITIFSLMGLFFLVATNCHGMDDFLEVVFLDEKMPIVGRSSQNYLSFTEAAPLEEDKKKQACIQQEKRLPKEILELILAYIPIEKTGFISAVSKQYSNQLIARKIHYLLTTPPETLIPDVRPWSHPLLSSVKKIHSMDSFLSNHHLTVNCDRSDADTQKYEQLAKKRISDAYRMRYSLCFYWNNGRELLEELMADYNLDGRRNLCDFFFSLQDPYGLCLINTLLLGGFTIGGYFLVSTLYNHQVWSYSSPSWQPPTDELGNCLIGQQGCRPCYYQHFDSRPNPNDIYKIATEMTSKIQKSCFLDVNSTPAVNDYIQNYLWHMQGFGPGCIGDGSICYKSDYLSMGYSSDQNCPTDSTGSFTVSRILPSCLAYYSTSVQYSLGFWTFSGIVVLSLLNIFVAASPCCFCTI